MSWRVAVLIVIALSGPLQWGRGAAAAPAVSAAGPPQQLRPGSGAEAPLSAPELAQWETLWRRWDAFLTYVIKRMAMDTELEALRVALLEALLAGRYDILRALAGGRSGGGDPIRTAFVRTWARLGPILQQLIQDQSGIQAQRYLAFISAGEALQTLDRYGGAVGLEITSQGMRRLARTLAPHVQADPLAYSQDVDPQLRRLLGFGPPLPLSRAQPTGTVGGWWLRSAWADDTPQRELVRRLNGWVPKRDELQIYLPLVRDLLLRTARATSEHRDLKPRYQGLYRRLVLATAWQESCWRQFTRRGGRIEPIRSGTGSVGLMQVNEKVWRGFYDIQGLRRDIAYNARAGSEILIHYLTDYAIRKGEYKHTGEIDNLARASYAVYNGGPAHLRRYRESKTPEPLRRIDAAFWNKYLAIKAGTELAVMGCFGKAPPRAGDPGAMRHPASGTAPIRSTGPRKEPSPQAPSKGGPAAIRGGDWVLRQDPRRYTLQLVAARSRETILGYIRRHGLDAEAAYYRFVKDDRPWFAVVWGSFPDRERAQRAAAGLPRSLRGTRPWTRTFGAIHKAIRPAGP